MCRDWKRKISKAHAATGNAREAGAAAHKIKGAASNPGAAALSSQIFEAEQAGKAGDLETPRNGIPEIERRFVQLKTALEEALFLRR